MAVAVMMPVMLMPVGAGAIIGGAHCLPPGFQYVVTFKPTVDLTRHDNGFLKVERLETSEEYDVGVLFLARPVVNIEPAELPDEGALEGYRKGASFTHVGYGFDRAGETDLSHFTRRTITSPLMRLSDTLLFTRNRDGSMCKGDSGGPVFNEAGVLVVLGNYTSGSCKGTNSGPRLDTPTARSFLSQFVQVPG